MDKEGPAKNKIKMKHAQKKHKNDAKKKLRSSLTLQKVTIPALPCQKCDQVFSDQQLLAAHMKTKHPSKNSTIKEKDIESSKSPREIALMEKYKDKMKFRECTGRYYCNMCMASSDDNFEVLAHIFDNHWRCLDEKDSIVTLSSDSE